MTCILPNETNRESSSTVKQLISLLLILSSSLFCLLCYQLMVSDCVRLMRAPFSVHAGLVLLLKGVGLGLYGYFAIRFAGRNLNDL